MNRKPFLILTCTLLLWGCGIQNKSKVTIDASRGSYEVRVEVARTPEEKRLGLMGREKLSDGRGMLFVYENGASPVMWMKNMLIPIDLLFIDETLTINYVEAEAPPCQDSNDAACARYSAPGAASYVLELPAGTAAKQGIEVGDSVTLLL